jgi:hypothetical protein
MSNTNKTTSTKPTKSHLSSLQLTEQHKVQNQDPVIQRRNKLIERLEVQRELAKCTIEGSEHEAYKYVTQVDESTGNKQKVRVPKTISPWHFKIGSDWFITLKYANKPLTISEGLQTVAVPELNALTSVYDVLLAGCAAGELDVSIKNVINSTKRKSN